MQARLAVKTIFKIDSLTTRYRLPAFTADGHLFARTLDGTIAPQLITAADTLHLRQADTWQVAEG